MTPGKEILFLAHRTPYPPDRGDKIRSWHVLQALARVAPVHVVALCTDPHEQRYVATLESVARSVSLIPHEGGKLAAVAGALVAGGSASVRACSSAEARRRCEDIFATGKIGAVYAYSGQMAQYVPEGQGDFRFIMDFVDMDSAKFAAWGEQGNPVARLANRFEARRLFAFERSIAQRADVSLFVSEAEASLFRSATRLDRSRVHALENGIDLQRYTPDHAARALPGQGPHLVFTGQMDYPPNVDAAIFFARSVLPLIRARVADARFWIVGRSPVSAVQALAMLDGVEVTGTVPDPRDHIAAADVVVAPLLLARGIQNKVLEAMAMGKAVLATPPAAEGIDARDGHDLAVADGAEALAASAVELLNAPAKCFALGQAARVRMENRYGWDATLAPLASLIAGNTHKRCAA